MEIAFDDWMLNEKISDDPNPRNQISEIHRWTKRIANIKNSITQYKQSPITNK
jgi:hypothetical protein